jgi:hypothetical protein
MLALLLAMSVATTTPPTATASDRPLVFRNGLNFVPTACRAGVTTAAGAGPTALLRPQDRAAVKARRLGDLPKANKEIAINRSVSGCSAPLIVSYEVEGNGHFAGGSGD